MMEHTVKAYDDELQELARLIVEMGGLAEYQIRDSVSALANRDEDLAGRVIAADDRIDGLQQQIEAMTIRMIGKRQPMGSDLRDIVGALHLSIDLERIGDFAKNIGKRSSALGEVKYPMPMIRRLKQMADLALAQLVNVVDAYMRRDAAKAIAVWRRDEEIDAMYPSLFRELLTYMMEEPRNITFSTHLLFCAKNIERIGDHTTNIAEAVYFMVEGIPVKNERPKRDETTLPSARSTA